MKRPRSTPNQVVPSNLSDSFANRRHETLWNVTNAKRNLIPRVACAGSVQITDFVERIFPPARSAEEGTEQPADGTPSRTKAVLGRGETLEQQRRLLAAAAAAGQCGGRGGRRQINLLCREFREQDCPRRCAANAACHAALLKLGAWALLVNDHTVRLRADTRLVLCTTALAVVSGAAAAPAAAEQGSRVAGKFLLSSKRELVDQQQWSLGDR